MCMSVWVDTRAPLPKTTKPKSKRANGKFEPRHQKKARNSKKKGKLTYRVSVSSGGIACCAVVGVRGLLLLLLLVIVIRATLHSVGSAALALPRLGRGGWVSG